MSIKLYLFESVTTTYYRHYILVEKNQRDLKYNET